jgi:hypothetical protein
VNNCTALAIGAALGALLCLVRRRRPEPVTDADLQKQLRQIHDDLFIRRRLTVESRQVLNDAHHRSYKSPR